MAELGLSVRGIEGSYGQGAVIQNIDLDVSPGKITCLMGLNGMGKTTTLRAIMGLLPHSSGEVLVDGVAVSQLPYKRARAGIAYVPEDRQVFPTLTVAENLSVARRMARKVPLLDDEIFDIFPKLADRRKQLAGTLSGGEQQMLVVARAIVTAPAVILLDEPSEGLAPEYVNVIYSALQILRSHRIGVLLVEQNFKIACTASDEFVVLNRGSVVGRANRKEVAIDPSVVERYLSLATSSSFSGEKTSVGNVQP